MGSFNPSYSVPEFDVVEGEVSYEFVWEDEYPIVVDVVTGRVTVDAGWWREKPERVVAFSGELYESEDKNNVLGEYEMFHLDVTLRPLSRWMELLSRVGNAEEPGSVEEFFYDFMLHLGYDADFVIPPDDIRDEYQEIADLLFEVDGLAESPEDRDESWKPYCTVYSGDGVEWGV